MKAADKISKKNVSPKKAAPAAPKAVKAELPAKKAAAKKASKSPVSEKAKAAKVEKETKVPAPKETKGKTSTASKVPTKATKPGKDVATRGKPAPAGESTGKPGQKKGTSRPNSRPVRPMVSFSWEEVRDYLRTRQHAKVDGYDPAAEKTTKTVAPLRKVEPAFAPEVKARNVGAVSVSDILGFNPFDKDAPEKEEDMIPQKWRKYYRLLSDMRHRLQDGLSLHTEDALKKTGKEDSGNLSGYSQHMADAGTDSFDRDFALSLVSSEQEALAEISDAIGRMKRGNYGICEITGKPIPADRLTAVPFTRYSLEGQRELERNRRMRRRGGALGNPLTELGDGISFGNADEAEEV